MGRPHRRPVLRRHLTLPTLGIFVTALRDRSQIVVSGWWTSFASSSQARPAPACRVGGVERDGKFFLKEMC